VHYQCIIYKRRRHQTFWTLWPWEQYGEWPTLPADVLGDLIVYNTVAPIAAITAAGIETRKAIRSNRPWACWIQWYPNGGRYDVVSYGIVRQCPNVVVPLVQCRTILYLVL